MPKIANLRERVHQPFRDTLVRTAGTVAGQVQDNTSLFTVAGKDAAQTNLPNGSTLPSDQSMVVLALRVFLWFRNGIERGEAIVPAASPVAPVSNGDYANGVAAVAAAQTLLAGNAPADVSDIQRLYWQAEEQLLWSFGAGEKFSITSMPSAYFPYGGGINASLGGNEGFMFANNGSPDHSGILRLARAVLIPPRQNLKVTAQIVSLADVNAGTTGSIQGSRNMLSLTANLNTVDFAQKVVSITFDGLFSRDVQ